jgi:hypothetical protein
LNRRSLMLVGLLAAAPAFAGAPVAAGGKSVRVVNEEAIIVWDEGAKREHFIHRASFDTDAPDFGFLVPTPAKPELGEADDRAFELTGRASAASLLEEKEIAGYHATVLEAGDADALQGWLKENGYSWSPALAAWLEPYAAAKWKITAFKVAADSPKVATSAVRMSFQAERPFFPYREPASAVGGKAADRGLVVYVLGDIRFDGALGAGKAWAGHAVWSKPIEKRALAELLRLAGLPILAGGGGLRLTRFEDFSSPRPGADDVFFSPAASQERLGPPADTPRQGGRNGWALGWALTGGAVPLAAFALWRLRRRRRNG